MKILNQELLEKVKNFVEEYCDNNGYGYNSKHTRFK